MVSPGLGILGRLGTPAMTPIIPKRVNDLHLKVPNVGKMGCYESVGKFCTMFRRHTLQNRRALSTLEK